MGLKDWLRTRPGPTNITVEEWNKLQRTVGTLSAQVESQQMVWESYRDEIKTLVERWRKREERRVKKGAAQEEEAEQPELTQRQVADEITERIWARRNKKRGSA